MLNTVASVSSAKENENGDDQVSSIIDFAASVSLAKK